MAKLKDSPQTKTCKQCESEIPKKASRCKNCGAKQPKDFWKSPWFYLVLIICLPIFISHYSDSQPGSGTSSTSSGTNATQHGNWEYSTKKDEIDDSEIKFAVIDSSNELDFDFPYNGGTTFTLTLRQTDGEDEVILQCSKCQFIGAGVYDDDVLKIRFDDGDFAKYSYTQPSDYSSDAVFIGSPTRLINGVKTAKELKIEAPFYQEGSHVIRFNVEGLKWE